MHTSKTQLYTLVSTLSACARRCINVHQLLQVQNRLQNGCQSVSPLPKNTMRMTLKIVSKCGVQCTLWFCRARHQHGACTRQPFVPTGAKGQLPDEHHASDLSERPQATNTLDAIFDAKVSSFLSQCLQIG